MQCCAVFSTRTASTSTDSLVTTEGQAVVFVCCLVLYLLILFILSGTKLTMAVLAVFIVAVAIRARASVRVFFRALLL